MSAHEEMDLRGFAREHHVHYEVRSDGAAPAAEGSAASFEVRLFASHGGPPLSTPTCERCHALREELRTFALHLPAVADPPPPWQVQVVPDPSALYTAKDDPRRDEVMLSLRVMAADRRDDTFVSHLQHDLAAAGVDRHD